MSTYNMFVDVGQPGKPMPKKKIYNTEKFIIMLIPDQFKDMVSGYYEKLNKTPKYISWHKPMPEYEKWVDWFCLNEGRSQPIHLYHGEQKKSQAKEDLNSFF